MWGEVTLPGKVPRVGGLKEKVLAAPRAGIQAVIVPHRNRKDFDEDVPEEIKKAMTFEFASDVGDVLKLALEPKEAAHKPARVGSRRAARPAAHQPVAAG